MENLARYTLRIKKRLLITRDCTDLISRIGRGIIQVQNEGTRKPARQLRPKTGAFAAASVFAPVCDRTVGDGPGSAGTYHSAVNTEVVMHDRNDMSRRDFIRNTSIVSSGLLVGGILSCGDGGDDKARGDMPTARIGDINVSALILGSNWFEGFSEGADSTYRHPFRETHHVDARALEAFQKAEGFQINAVMSTHCLLSTLEGYWKNGGKMHWFAEGHPTSSDMRTHIQRSIDHGATAVHVVGGRSDTWVREGRVDLIEDCVEFIREEGALAGVGAHSLETVRACIDAGISPDFIVKTLHPEGYCAPVREDLPDCGQDSNQGPCSSVDPEKTIEYMRTVDLPWIAIKVLAAGRISPSQGCTYAFNGGATFICVGMEAQYIAHNSSIVTSLWT